MRVLVVGGGVTGLVAAYLLEQAGVDVDLVEKTHRLGGNAVTRRVVVGDEVRWVDLGVNDFNAPTYPKLTRLLDEVGVQHRPLDDSASFFFRDGGTVFTLDGRWSTAMPRGLDAEYARFAEVSRADYDNYPAVRDMTVHQYLTFRQFSSELADLVILPRVSAMYFASDLDPAHMPFAAAMSYYRRQEGTAQSGVDRRFFVGGSEGWLRALASRLQGTVFLNTGTRIEADDQGVQAYFSDTEVRPYDAVLLTCSPSEVLCAVTAGLDPRSVRSLASFRYSNSVAVAHTYSGVMPPDTNAWRTYNITIRDATPGLRPYSMTYWENLHQNDASNDLRRTVGQTATMLVTVNPLVPIPSNMVLRDEAGEAVTATFRHVVIDFASLRAQRELQSLQGHSRVFLAGGWMSDVGLHESCIESAQSSVDAMLEANLAHARRSVRSAAR